MIPNNTGFARALDRAAHRWKKAFLIIEEPTAPRFVVIADYRDAKRKDPRQMPSPFRPYRG